MSTAVPAGGAGRSGPILGMLWLMATVVLGAWILRVPPGFTSGLGLALMAGVPCTAALLWWLRLPALPEQPAVPARTGRLALPVAGVAIVLFAIAAVFGRSLMFGVPVLAAVLLVWLRPPLNWRPALYALGLALIAGVAGLGVGHITFISTVEWAALQVPLVWLSLLAGWALLEHTGLAAAGLGRSLYLSVGPAAALKGFVQGFLLAIPWALAGIVMGSASNDQWAVEWWRPLAALQPAIAEEAWARLLLMALLFLILRRAGRAGPALTAAVLVGTYWFAYLHTIDTPGLVSQIISTLLIGTLFNVPLSYVWLRRGLETAIGFHFCMDAVRFGVAVLMNLGVTHL